MLSEVTKANQRLKQLNYTTSHDLRSPVSNLLAVFSLIDTSTINDPETLEFIELLKTAVYNLKKTLDDYVDNLQSDESHHVNTEQIDLMEILGSVRTSVASLLEDSKVNFTIDFNGFSMVSFNRAYLESVFLNLITNSVKYAHPDRDPEITIKTSITDNTKQLTFSDNGLGFDSVKLQGKVFGLHQKFHNHEDSKGIGLYLVHNHMTNLGGNISVHSEVGKGTTFTLTFKD